MPDEWFDDLDLFKDLFLGKTDFAEDCRIENENYLEFEHPKENIMVVKMGRPMVIINDALGFKISCGLQKFKYDYDKKKFWYTHQTYFEEMQPAGEQQKGEWEENRAIAFLGSMEHFLSCLVKNNFRENGYEVQVTRVPSSQGFSDFRYDHYAADSLLTSYSGGKLNVLEYSGYLQARYVLTRVGKKQVSWLRLNFGYATLDQYGYPMELLSLQRQGYWGIKGFAEALPKYYYAYKELLVQ